MLASMFPQRVSALVLEDPPWRDVINEEDIKAHAAEWAQTIAERKKLSPEEMLQAGKAENPTWQDAEFEPWIEAKYQVSPKVVSYIGGGNLNWQGAAKRIECATLLLTADPALGARITKEVSAKVRAANPKIEIVNIPGAGHNIRREQLDAYLAAVQSFLALHYPSR